MSAERMTLSSDRAGEVHPFADSMTGCGSLTVVPAGDRGSPTGSAVEPTTTVPRGKPMYYLYSLIAALHTRVEDAKDRGATATEYAMLVAFIAIAITVGVIAFGNQLSTWFDNLGNKIGLNK
jgi:Flp pilus assembly pilin Flp